MWIESDMLGGNRYPLLVHTPFIYPILICPGYSYKIPPLQRFGDYLHQYNTSCIPSACHQSPETYAKYWPLGLIPFLMLQVLTLIVTLNVLWSFCQGTHSTVGASEALSFPPLYISCPFYKLVQLLKLSMTWVSKILLSGNVPRVWTIWKYLVASESLLSQPTASMWSAPIEIVFLAIRNYMSFQADGCYHLVQNIHSVYVFIR